MNTFTATTSSKVLETLDWLRSKGFKAVALEPSSKAAISRKYVEPDYLVPPDSFWQSGNYGIGVLLGPKAGGPVDIDLDCPEAIALAPHFFPPTLAIFGRPSKLASHRLYRVIETELKKQVWRDPLTGATLLEVRADGGHQTVMPGSVHPSGEPIRWANGVPYDTPSVESEALIQAANRTALACLIVRHLWLEGSRNEVTKHIAGMLAYLDWNEGDVQHLIAAVMAATGDDDKTRARTVQATFKKYEAGGRVTGGPALRKHCRSDALVDKLLEYAGAGPESSFIQDYNERFAVASLEDKIRVADCAVKPGKAPVFRSKTDFEVLMANDALRIDGKRVPKSKLWLTHPRRRLCLDVDFLPGVEDTGSTLNLWTGWSTPPDSDSRHSCQAWLELLRSVICGNDDKLETWMLHWFANIVREPRAKAMTAPVLIGKQGAGKSLLLAYFGRILGPAYTVVTDERHVYGHFNKHLATTLLLHSEEALYAGDKKHRSIIKSLITDESRMFEQKGIDAKSVRNYLRLVLTSNEQHAAPVEAGDRRFTVVDMGERKISPELKKRVLEEMANGGPAALHSYLLRMPYDPELARNPLKGSGRREMMEQGMDPIDKWWLNRLEEGSILPDYLSWAMRGDDGDHWPSIVSSVAMHKAYVIEQSEARQRIVDDRVFAARIKKLVGVKKFRRGQRDYSNPHRDPEAKSVAPPAVKQMNDRQDSILDMPSLEHCRKAFEEHMGETFDWPSGVPDEERPVWERG